MRVRAIVPSAHRRGGALEVVSGPVDPSLVASAASGRAMVAAAHGEFSGAVVTLLPSAADAERLALQGFEPPDALHVTLAWLGDTDGDPAPAVGFDQAVEEIGAALERATPGEPIEAEAFALAVFNPASDEREPATVLLVQGDALVDLRGLVVETVGDASSFVVWFPHLTLGYSTGDAGGELDDAAIAARMGPVVFDRVRVAYGSEQTAELPLAPTEGETMTASTRPRVRVIVPEQHRATVTAAVGEQEFDEAPETAEAEGVEVPTRAAWEGVLVLEGVPTGDGRMMAEGSLRWENLPLPLRWARTDEGQHLGAVTVGRILEVWRDGKKIRARGDLDLRIDEARELAALMAPDEDGPTISGVSVDLDDVDVEVRVAEEVLDAMESEFAEPGEDEAQRQVDDDGRVVVWEFAADDELMVTTDGRIRAATIVDVPAFIDARLELTDDPAALAASAAAAEPDLESLTAGAAPARPPRSWFPGPDWSPTREASLVTDERTGVAAVPVRVTKDGRIFGHIAPWKSCHTGFRECVNPPASGAGYRYFHVGAVETDDGTEVATGRITLDTLHAGRRLSAVDTLAHYENTGLAVADVVAGEDEHGVWISGAVRPGVTDEQLRSLRASPLSGDWRRIGGGLELVAALAVNSPGFPVPRALVASGEVVALQSAGALAPIAGERDASLTDDELEILRRMAQREQAAADRRRGQADGVRRRMLVASAADRVHGRA